MFEGVEYFESHPRRGKFVKLLTLQPDKRYLDVKSQDFKVGSRVQFGIPKTFGMIKWIGIPDGCDEEYAKVKTVSNN